jgi:hypothetical protein
MVMRIESLDWLVGKVTELLFMVYWGIGDANWEKKGCCDAKAAGGMINISSVRATASGR